MSKINDGGPAFPTLMKCGDLVVSDGGMSLHDYFAAHCPITQPEAVEIANDLNVLIDAERNLEGLMRWYADLRVRYADAMLAARSAASQPAQPSLSEWIEWSGGELPVPDRQRVEVEIRNGIRVITFADACEWEHDFGPADIIRYRVVP